MPGNKLAILLSLVFCSGKKNYHSTYQYISYSLITIIFNYLASIAQNANGSLYLLRF